MPNFTPLMPTPYLTILLLLAFFSTPITARPSLQKRGLPGAAYICDGTHFSGNCAWRPPEDECIIAGSAKSVGPDPGGYCTLYEKFDCTGKIRTLRFPGAGSHLPAFQGIRCTADGMRKSVFTGKKESGGENANIIGMVEGNPDLAGGVGSVDWVEHEEDVVKMKEDGGGMLGLKKHTYY